MENEIFGEDWESLSSDDLLKARGKLAALIASLRNEKSIKEVSKYNFIFKRNLVENTE